MNTLIVALNLRSVNVPALINRSRFWTQQINSHAGSFPNCINTVAKVVTATDELELADEATVDGGKTKFREKRDKRKKLLSLLTALAHQVEEAADGDESIVHLAGMEVKRVGRRSVPAFKVEQANVSGSVQLKVKARKKTVYKWQYATDPSLASWIDAGITRVCQKAIGQLSSGVYWFRVVFIDDSGEHNGDVFKFAVT